MYRKRSDSVFKTKKKEIKDFQERTVYSVIKLLARNKPELFKNWSEDKLKSFALYCINPKKANVSKTMKREFEEVYNSEITVNEIKKSFRM